MAAANVNTTVVKIAQIGSNKNGDKKGYFKAKTKAAQNDTLTFVGIDELVLVTSIKIDATGAWETHTVSGKVVTLTSETTGTVSGEIIYR